MPFIFVFSTLARHYIPFPVISLLEPAWKRVAMMAAGTGRRHMECRRSLSCRHIEPRRECYRALVIDRFHSTRLPVGLGIDWMLLPRRSVGTLPWNVSRSGDAHLILPTNALSRLVRPRRTRIVTSQVRRSRPTRPCRSKEYAGVPKAKVHLGVGRYSSLPRYVRARLSCAVSTRLRNALA